MALYNAQKIDSRLWGKNVITVNQSVAATRSPAHSAPSRRCRTDLRHRRRHGRMGVRLRAHRRNAGDVLTMGREIELGGNRYSIGRLTRSSSSTCRAASPRSSRR
jgi:hypothetical protein